MADLVRAIKDGTVCHIFFQCYLCSGLSFHGCPCLTAIGGLLPAHKFIPGTRICDQGMCLVSGTYLADGSSRSLHQTDLVSHLRQFFKNRCDMTEFYRSILCGRSFILYKIRRSVIIWILEQL